MSAYADSNSARKTRKRVLTLNRRLFEKFMEKSSFELIYDVVKRIPYGRVASYGQIAALAGNKKWARVVGYALHANPDPDHIPCYRVVNKEGRVSKAFAFGGENQQIRLLKAEGVSFIDQEHVDMEHFQWDTAGADLLGNEPL